MTISTTGNQVMYTGDGASLAFAFPYPFITNADLKVYVNGVLQTTGYSVAGVAPTGGSGTFQNGTVTFSVAPALSAVVLIYCDPDLTQSTTLPPNDPFPSKTVEKMIDKVTLLIQRITTKFGNAITYPAGDSASGVLPAAAVRAGNLVSFDSNGNAQVVAPVAGSATALAIDLASNAQPTKNSGQIGFAYGLAYVAGTIGRWLQDLATSVGAAFIGWVQSGTAAVTRLVQDKLRERLSVFDFMTPAQIADVLAYTYTQNVSLAIYTAQQAAIATGKALHFPAGGYFASISARYNNVALIGDGSAVTRIKLPASSITITSIQCTAANPHTVIVTTATAHGAWIGKSVSVVGSSQATENVPYIVTAVADATHFTAVSKSFNGTVGTFAGGAPLLYEASPLELGEGAHGNSAATYSGATIRGLTVDGNSAARPANPTDSTDYGLFLTAFSNYHISDVYAVNCRSVGVGACINSNDGYIQAIVDNCGATLGYPGFDVNSSKRVIVDIVSKNCYQGARVLDNCIDVVGKIAVQNATSIGFVHQNQSVNESYSNTLDVSVNTTGSHGAVIGENVRGCNIRITTQGAGGYGVVINEASVPGNRVSECNLDIATRNSQLGGLLCYGNRNNIRHTSRLDGRAGAAGSSYALEVYGDANTIEPKIFDSGTPQVRGIAMRSGASDNDVFGYFQTGIVGAAAGGLDDSGTRTKVNGWLSGSATYDPPSLADGAGATTTVTVTGAAIGDFAVASFGQDLQGITVTAYVSAANTVSVRFQNESGGTLDLSSLTLRARVMKALT